MKDFPIFSTKYGVASLVLKQVPYNGCAYITLQESLHPNDLLRECFDFCKAVGAEHVYASGHCCLENKQLHTVILMKRCLRVNIAETDAVLLPVLTENAEQFRGIYNDAMRNVPNASYLSVSDVKKILEDGTGYFVYKKKRLIGIGVAGGERIEALVSVEPGCGSDVLLALNRALSGQFAEVEVASSNTRAMRLYDKMGFQTLCEVSRWYKIS